ncbi:MAG TPA: methyltransferase [Solirubrobacteraceae bacterium]|jgi:protein-L-isoaspartate O-methyltransferase|nr:methyltransferase [Solirubrobacteraceae bacterium]
MPSRAFQVAPEVAAVLADVTVEDGAVKLPDELARPLYAAVNKALAAIGGHWDRRRGGHVFPAGVDAGDRLAELLGSGRATSARAAGFFATPPALVAELVAVAQILPHHRVLEPSAGHGALAARVVEIVGADNLTIVELLDENCRVLRGLGYEPVHGDFLTVDLDGPFDRIVMNPPFDGRQDVRHVAHAFGLLAPGGRLVAVMAESVTYRDDRATRAIRELVDACGSVTRNPARSFAASGTDIATVTVLLDKPAAPFAGAASTACPALRADAKHTHHHED